MADGQIGVEYDYTTIWYEPSREFTRLETLDKKAHKAAAKVKDQDGLKAQIRSHDALSPSVVHSSDKSVALKATVEQSWPFIALFARFELLIKDILPIPLDTTVLWQLLAIVIGSSFTLPREAKAVEFTFRFIREVGRRLEYFVNIVPTSDISGSHTAKPELLQNLVDIVYILSKVYNCFKSDYSIGNDKTDLASLAIGSECKQTINDMDKRFQHFVTLADLKNSGFKLSNAQHQDEVVALSDLVVPIPQSGTEIPVPAEIENDFPSNPDFFGRERLLSEVAAHLDLEASRHELRSLAIFGLGGVGKTQIAMEFAKQEANTSIVLWINSETRLSLTASFTSIATTQLKLPGASAKAEQENRILVLNWLKKTNHQWLLIFDNAEDSKSLREFWPTSNHGRVLITSRNHILASQPASKGIEITTFEEDEGAQFIIFLLQHERHGEPSQKEMEAAKCLSEKLQGHALAIHQMVALILLFSWTVEEFLEIYDQNARELHREEHDIGHYAGYAHFLATVWKLSFDTLTSTKSNHRLASMVLGVLSFMSADDIPEVLFTSKEVSPLPDSLQGCHTTFGIGKHTQILVSLALIKRNREHRTISLHRLVQTEYQYYLEQPHTSDQPKLTECFELASLLLKRAFPEQVRGRSMLELWSSCQQYAQHALALVNVYEERSRNLTIDNLPANISICELIKNLAWFVKERGDLKQSLELAEIGLRVFDACPANDQDLLIKDHLSNTVGVCYLESGSFEKSRGFFEECLKVRVQVWGPDHEEVGNVHNNLGITVGSLGLHREALVHQQEAERIRMLEPDPVVKVHNLGLSDLNLGRAIQYSDLPDASKEAELRFKRSRDYFMSTDHWYFTTHSIIALGILYFKAGEIEKARAEFVEAKNIMLANQARHHPTTGAIYCRLGHIDLVLKDAASAEEHLRLSVRIAQLHGLAEGELSRTKHMLSRALKELGGHDDEATRLDNEARLLRKHIQGDSYREDDQSEDVYHSLVPYFF